MTTSSTESKKPKHSHHDVPVDDEKIRAEMARASPEGMPASPRLGPHGILMLIGALSGVVVLAGLLIGFLINARIGLVVTAFSLVLLFILNPAVWASFQRARERERLIEKLAEEEEEKRS